MSFMKCIAGQQRNSHRLLQPPTQGIIDACESNLLQGSRKLLVLFLCKRFEEIRLFGMHLEVLQADTTHGTNRENK